MPGPRVYLRVRRGILAHAPDVRCNALFYCSACLGRTQVVSQLLRHNVAFYVCVGDIADQMFILEESELVVQVRVIVVVVNEISALLL